MLIGIVGKPSVGKSTFFKAATMIEVERADYPFTTIEPNEGVGYVRITDAAKFFGLKSNPRHGYVIDDQRFVPIKLLDVAGLVPGAHEGKGLGNKFLDDLRQADALIHVVDASGGTNEKGEKVPLGSYDPINDIKFLEEELNYWYAGIFKRGWDKFARSVNDSIDKAIAERFSGLKINRDMVKQALAQANLDKPLREWSEEDILHFAAKLREISKPILIAANKCDLPTAKENIERMKKEFPNYIIIPTSAEAEIALKEAAKKGLIKYIPGDDHFEVLKPEALTDVQKKALEFIEENVLKKCGSTGVQQALNSAVFELLKYIAVFPGGVNSLRDSEGRVLPDVFLLPPGSTALDFAKAIHTDLAKGFIKAIDVKTKRVVGKDYQLKNGDVIEIVFK